MSFFDQPARVTRFKLVHAVWRRQRMEMLPGVAPVSLLLARTKNTVVGLTTNLQDVRRLRLDLEPWRDTPAVRELDEQLAAAGGAR